MSLELFSKSVKMFSPLFPIQSSRREMLRGLYLRSIDVCKSGAPTQGLRVLQIPCEKFNVACRYEITGSLLSKDARPLLQVSLIKCERFYSAKFLNCELENCRNFHLPFVRDDSFNELDI